MEVDDESPTMHDFLEPPVTSLAQVHIVASAPGFQTPCTCVRSEGPETGSVTVRLQTFAVVCLLLLLLLLAYKLV
jgi:hypothetical protein